MKQQRFNQNRSPLRLPPPELWKFNPNTDEPLPTPVDSYGLVDTKALISIVKSTVDPSFTWQPSERPDRHHLYWEHNKYPNTPDRSINPHTFCNLPANKILVPRMFHNWLHRVTGEPERPSEEVMRYCIEAQRAVTVLFKAARKSDQLDRARHISQKRRERGIERHFRDFVKELEAVQAIPAELRPIDVSEYHVETPADMRIISQRLGELAVKKTVTRIRDVVKPHMT